MKSFSQLFAGRDDCYGTYQITEKRSDGKKKGRGRTCRDPVTEELYQLHLSGGQMVGIVPVTTSGNCSWFAIDIDVYDISQDKLREQIVSLELPVVQCRSKSGGAHLYCFIKGTITGDLAMRLAKKWIDSLGYKSFDIYPKQATTDEEGFGNWIILPYYGGDKTERYAFGVNGERLSLKEFEQLANAKLITEAEALQFFKDVGKDEWQLWGKSPPCIEHFAENGVDEGGRNHVMSHICVFYKKVDPDNWRDLVVKFNFDKLEPPLPMGELNQIIRNHAKKNYQYYCKQNPMASFCKKEDCKNRKYVVGPDTSFYAELQIDQLIKIDSRPPIWIVCIRDHKIKMDTEQLLTPRIFRRLVADELNEIIPLKKQPAHDAVIGPLMKDSLVIEEAPDDVSLAGQILNVFREWCKNMISRCKSRDDIAKGLPFFEDGVIFFRGEDFQKAFRATHRKNIQDRDVWAELRDLNCYPKAVRVRGEVIKLWHYPLNGEKPWFKVPDDNKF